MTNTNHQTSENSENLEQELNATAESTESAESASAEGSSESAQAEESTDVQEQKVQDHPDFVELNSKYLRLHAEFDNYRRRTAREQLDVMSNANAKIMGRLVDVLENFERATDLEHSKASVEDYTKGVLLIKDQFSNVLKEFGLNILNPQGEKFDPNFHEALMQQAHPEIPEEHVVQVFQKGYKLNDKVIKHAKVIVSTGN